MTASVKHRAALKQVVPDRVRRKGKRKRLSQTISDMLHRVGCQLSRSPHDGGTGFRAGALTLTVRDYLDDWLNATRDSVAESTACWYRLIVEKHIEPQLGDVTLQCLTPIMVQQFYCSRLAEGNLSNPGASLSTNTVLGIHRVLSAALEEAVRTGLIRANPCDFVSPPRKTKREVRFWTAPEAAAFLHKNRGDRLYALYFLALGTGMRRSEILGLRWQDIDLPRARLTVAQAVVKTLDGVVLKQPKTDRSCRTISLSPQTVAVLEHHRLQMDREATLLGNLRVRSDLVFTKVDGTALDPDYISGGYFRRLIRRAGVRRVSFHGLRHTHATLLAQSGIPLKTVSERLGHSSVSVTGDVYSHVCTEMDRRAAKVCDELLHGQGSADPRCKH